MWWNKIKTGFLLTLLSGLLAYLGFIFGGTDGLRVALVFSLVMNVIMYFFAEKFVLSMYRAKPLDPHTYNWVYETIAEITQDLKIPMPKLWLIQTNVANAFATGRNPRHASIALTSGILELLDRDELRGVLAHEVSHIYNRDILVATIAATIATAIAYLASIMRYIAVWGSHSNDRNRRGNPLLMMLVGILMPVAATLIQLAISRTREYHADETGARTTHEPLALASALQKLHDSVAYAHMNRYDMTRVSTASMFIVYPFVGNGWLSLFATHPPIAKRIERLQNIARELS